MFSNMECAKCDGVPPETLGPCVQGVNNNNNNEGAATVGIY